MPKALPLVRVSVSEREEKALRGYTNKSYNNPQLSSPPPEIVEQETQAILTYLRARLEGKQ